MGGGVRHRGVLMRALRGQSSEGAHRAEARRIIRSPEEYELFLHRYKQYPRFVLGQAHTFDRPVPRPLSDVLRKVVTRISKSDKGMWRGFVVAVDESDGMTWSAAAAAQVVG